MFSGIIEVQSKILNCRCSNENIRISVERPNKFDDLEVGQSIALNGICLTVEDFDKKTIDFTVAAETLHITKWTVDILLKTKVNLERSLKWNDRIHGHCVTGHVDTVSEVKYRKILGDNIILGIEILEDVRPFIWKKGSVSVNGVSLTVNEVTPELFSVCLIPETLKRTNLVEIKEGDVVNIEVDNMGRGIVHQYNLCQEQRN